MEIQVNMSISKRVNELLEKYPSLHVEAETEEYVKLTGFINVHRCIDGYVLNKKYNIEVHIPREKSLLPYVIDAGKVIKPRYPHIYKDRKLCLATDVDMMFALKDNPSLARWMYDFVETFFFSYEYYERYGLYPMGDRPHGAKGIIQSYMEIFGIGEEAAIKMLFFMANNRYRGHQPCPCGSGEKIRKCHGKKLLEFYNDSTLLEQVIKDSELIIEEVRQYVNNKQLGYKE